jgi:hypothetical protein
MGTGRDAPRRLAYRAELVQWSVQSDLVVSLGGELRYACDSFRNPKKVTGVSGNGPSPPT